MGVPPKLDYYEIKRIWLEHVLVCGGTYRVITFSTAKGGGEGKAQRVHFRYKMGDDTIGAKRSISVDCSVPAQSRQLSNSHTMLKAHIQGKLQNRI